MKLLHSRIGNKLFLNGIALLGVLTGLGNIGWAWLIFGTSETADIWMLSLVIVQSFALLSQAGVEQYAVFFAEQNEISQEAGSRFARECMSWAAIFGLTFAVLLFTGLPLVVRAFAHGFEAAAQVGAGDTTDPMVLQVLVTPMLYVFRQQLLMKGREQLSVLLNHLFGFVQFVAFCILWLSGEMSSVLLAWLVGGGSILACVMVIALADPFQRQFAAPDLRRLWPFVRASLQLRFTNSIHNFVVVLLTISALSAGVPGTVALFQYVKRMADGLAAIAVGPHMFVYHNLQARAWIQGDRDLFRKNVVDYLNHTVPLMVLAVLFAGCVWLGLQVAAPNFAEAFSPETIGIFLALWSWQLLIAIEGIPAGLLVVAKRIVWVFAVNSFYVFNFYSVMHFVVSPPYTGLAVAVASLACQAISAILFSHLALRLYRQHLGRL